MNRWHSPSCQTPNILVRGSKPFCKTCAAEPDIKALVDAKKNDSPFPPCPSDELPGNFNFFWPPTVPYVSRGTQIKAVSRGNTAGPSQAADTGTGATETSPNVPSTNPIYPGRLKHDEIRLIILPAVADNAYPIHIDLETHQDGRCPEYETASYSWGGEDGDSSSCCPLFVGPHWDVLLLTKNCSDMLRFFRPWRGTRMVWVDSICINQDDIQEREAQVAKMAHIYSECRQAVVYLGDDVVKATAPGQYPPRKRLEDSIGTLPASHAALVDEAKGMVDIDRLLNRRYFSRVWIIQELILPRQVAIPVGTMELYADKDTGPSLRSRPGMIAAAPWLTAVGQRQIATEQQGSIYSILLTTSKSHATDPRDKVFGAHALINNDVDDREALRPNYSLSCLHVFFGAFSHCLIKLKRTELLCNAAGASARTGYPSWTPDWTSPGATQHWFLKRPLIWETDRERPWDPQSRKERWTGERFSFPKEWWTGESFCKWWAMGDGRPNSQPDSVTMHVSTESRRWRTDSELYRDEKILSYDWSRGIPLELFTTEAELRYAELRQGSQWDHAPAVDATNGSLSIRLIHILRFETVPEKAGSALRARIFKVSSPATGAEMYLTTDLNFSLNRHVVAGRDHLFLLDRGASSPPLYLVMRKCQGGPWQFKLLGCCFHLCFHASPGTWTRRSVKVRYNRYDSDRDEIVIEDQVPRQDDHLFLADLQRPLTDTIASVRASVEDILQNDAEDSSRLLCIGERANAMALLPVFQGLLNERKGASPGLLESYAAYVGEKHQTTVHGEHLELVIQPEDWETTYTPELASLFKEWKYDAAASDSEWSSSRKVRYSLFRSKKPIRIRTAKSDLEKAVSDSKVYTELSRLSRAPSIGTGTTEVSMLDRAGWREDAGRLADPAWPKSIVEGFKIDGGTYNVTIL